ncbi:uncharacterized protein LOC130636885 [Hydractinia symbiolongicarpus]|uniref:uncharacterized protein LOC130636885 n=1 Tax=Hydractinia symbiolongicarpus TaxID=13093 RepID=UPI002549EF76|nr:uncharacterized protein LOC130636885 [Hydractinia symbiolongicarpus]
MAANIRPTLHDEVEKDAEEDYLEEIQNLYNQTGKDYTPQEHKHALHRTFRSFRIPGIGGADVDGYIGMVRPNVKKLVEDQVEDMGSAKIQLSLWFMWKKKKTNPEQANDGEHIKGSDVDDMLDRMFAQIKTHVENSALPPQSGFTINRILHLDVDFHKLRLTRASSCIELPKWIASKEAVINPVNEDEECFKWAVIASLHHEEGVEFPTSTKTISKLEENNSDIAVNVLYVIEKKINILRRSEYNIRRNKQASPTVESRDKHYRYSTDHGAVKITMPTEAEKWLYYCDGQQQFKIAFAIYADFESLLIPVEDARGKKTKKLSKHALSGWCTYSTFAPDPLTVYRGEDCGTRFVNHLEDGAKRLYYAYPQEPMTKLTEAECKRHDEAAHCHICMKPFDHRDSVHRFLPINGIIARQIGKQPHWYKRCRHEVSSQLHQDKVKANVPSMGEFIDKDDVFRLILRKGVYPYEYMDGWQRFEESELPAKEAFYSKLNMKGISDNDYGYAKKVWDVIIPEGDNVTMGDYHDIYLTIDVLLLADVFETFRGCAWTTTALIPPISTPRPVWHGIRLELLTDPDKLLMFEKVGDASGPTNRWFQLGIERQGIHRKADREFIEGNKHGYILEVDIDYPKELHDKHNKLPFLHERTMVYRVKKLVPNLEHKHRYVVHIRALHNAIKHGLELKNVRSVIRFNQKAWLKGYINHNTRLKANAKNEFEKGFYKLMNLSVFGKTMENIRNQCNI